MSFGGFGVSAGDLIAVGTFAWNVYKACKGASAEFEEIAHEVVTLHTALKELEDEAENTDSILHRASSSKRKELDEIIRNCRTVLTQLEKLLTKYKSLGTKSKRTWDRIKFGVEGLQTIREKLTFHTSGINLFLTTLGNGSLGRIEKKLDEIVEEVRAGKREPTVLTTVSDDDGEEAELHWNALKSELLDDGFTRHDVEAHKRSIKAYIQELVDRGELQESRRESEQLEHSLPDINAGQSAARESNYDSGLPKDLSLKSGFRTVLSAQSSITAPYQEQLSNIMPVRQREEAVNKPDQLRSLSEKASDFLVDQKRLSSLTWTPGSNYGLGRGSLDQDHENDNPMPDLPSEDRKPANSTSLFPKMEYSTFLGARPSLFQPLPALTAIPPTVPTNLPQTIRRTLTDDDRRRMCQFHEDNPDVKQTEIGAMFGVERSTVSKVLRQKEKYLVPKEENPSAIAATKDSFQRIEQALVAWVRRSRAHNMPMTDDTIRKKALFFGITLGCNSVRSKVYDTEWLESFKKMNGFGGENFPRTESMVNGLEISSPVSMGSVSDPKFPKNAVDEEDRSHVSGAVTISNERDSPTFSSRGPFDFPPAPVQLTGFNPTVSPISYGQPPSLKRHASGPVEDYHEDVSEYDEYGRLRKRTIVRRGSSPGNAMPSHHSSPIPSPSSWGHASPASGHNSAFLPPADLIQPSPYGWPATYSSYVPPIQSQSPSYGFPQTYVDMQALSKARDDKRGFNPGASARFRERRREKAREAAAQVQQVEEKNLKLIDEVNDLTQKLVACQIKNRADHESLKRHIADLSSYVVDVQTREHFYKEERNYFRAIVNQMPDKVDLVRQRPASPIAITTWPKLECPKPESPLNKVQHMLWEMEAIENGGLMDES